MFMVFAGIGPSCVLHEPVLYWKDTWLPLHQATIDPQFRGGLQPSNNHPAARQYVEELRLELVALMAQHFGAHLQIGRAYPFLQGRDQAFQRLIAELKSSVDPDGVINPGALGLASGPYV